MKILKTLCPNVQMSICLNNRARTEDINKPVGNLLIARPIAKSVITADTVDTIFEPIYLIIYNNIKYAHFYSEYC